NQDVAVKQMHGDLAEREFMSEARVMVKLRPHGMGINTEKKFCEKLIPDVIMFFADNVVQLLGVCKQPPMLVIKFYQNGSLLDFLRRHKAAPLPPSIVLRILRGISGEPPLTPFMY